MSDYYYSYHGREVIIPWHADIQKRMRPDGEFANLVQELIDGIEPWEKNESPIETLECDGYPIWPMTVPVESDDVVTWAIHRGHKARSPQASPFVRRTEVGIDMMGLITVELVGTPEAPMLVRAYGGEYAPPLPWMKSAKDAEGGLMACYQYWLKHAYLLTSDKLIKRDEMNTPPPTSTPPKWYRSYLRT